MVNGESVGRGVHCDRFAGPGCRPPSADVQVGVVDRIHVSPRALHRHRRSLPSRDAGGVCATMLDDKVWINNFCFMRGNFTRVEYSSSPVRVTQLLVQGPCSSGLLPSFHLWTDNKANDGVWQGPLSGARRVPRGARRGDSSDAASGPHVLRREVRTGRLGGCACLQELVDAPEFLGCGLEPEGRVPRPLEREEVAGCLGDPFSDYQADLVRQ